MAEAISAKLHVILLISLGHIQAKPSQTDEELNTVRRAGREGAHTTTDFEVKLETQKPIERNNNKIIIFSSNRQRLRREPRERLASERWYRCAFR